MPQVKILTSDGVEHVMDSTFVAKYFKTLENTINDVGDYETAIPIPNVNSQYFNKIVEYTRLAIHIEEVKKSEGVITLPAIIDCATTEQSVSSLENDFYDQIQKDIELTKSQLNVFLESILNGCDYLENELLLDLMCKMTARMIVGKSPEEIRKMLNLKDDLTQTEKDEITEKFTL